MLINLRNALMAGKRLPYDAEVEYLEFTGTQHIDSGINYFPDFDIDVLIPSGVPNVTLYSDIQHLLERKNASQPYWVVTAPESLLSSVPIAGRHRVVFRNSVLTIDNTTIGTVGNRTSGSDTCLIFRRKGGSAYKGTLYSLKMWDSNGVLVRDFIPVRKGTVGYLYDRVSGKLFGNAGTGDFVLGPDKN